MNITIKRVDMAEQIFLTQGDWRYDKDGNYLITVVKMCDWRYEFAIVVHEIVELAICKYKGVTIEQCDAFDAVYEEGYRNGTIPLEKEAGYDKKCPYYKGHVWGDRISWFVGLLIGVSLKEYNKEAYRVLDEYAEKTNAVLTKKPEKS